MHIKSTNLSSALTTVSSQRDQDERLERERKNLMKILKNVLEDVRYLHRRKKARTDKRVEIPLGKRSMRKHTRSSCHLDALPCRHITRNGPMNLGSNLLLPTLFTSCLDMLTVQRNTRSPSLLQKNSCFYILVSIQYLSFHCNNDGSLHEMDHCLSNLQNLLC